MPVDLDKIKEQYSNLQNLNIPTPQPMPYRIPNAYGASSMQYNAGMTAAQQMRSFANMPTPRMSPRAMGYDSAIANQVGSLATNYEDIVNARSVEAGGTIGSIGGSIIGGTIGGVAGPGGMMSGASTGSFIGGMAGGVLNAIPGVGHAMRGWQRWRHGGAMQQMAGMNQIQQGLFGNVSLGGEDAGAGGMGINPMAAHGLMSKLGTTASGGFNQSMAKITSMAGQTGFLDSATNIDQIAGTVKKLVSVMGEVAKLTGDPSFRNNMKELANMKDMGLSIDQSVQALKDLRMHGRMAGGHRFAQQGAMQGAQMFQAAGLTQGVGAQVGGGMAGIANAAMGGFTDIQRGLYQGKEGVTTALTAAAANFMGNTSGLVLPYVVERGPDGKMRINQEKLQAVQSGKIGLQQLAADGAGNVARMGFRGAQDLLNAAPELKTEMTQKLGGIGAFTTMANMGLGLMKSVPGMTLETAMTTVNRGDQTAGNMMAAMMRSPEMIEKMKAQVEEQKSRVRFEGRGQAIAIKATERSAFGQWWDRSKQRMEDQNPFARSDENEAAQYANEAWEQAREQQKAADEAAGVERVVDKQSIGQSEQVDRDLARKRISGKKGRAARRRIRGGNDDTIAAGKQVDVYGNKREVESFSVLQAIGSTNLDATTYSKRHEIGKNQLEAADLISGRDSVWSRSSETIYKGYSGTITAPSEEGRKVVESDLAAAREGGALIEGLGKSTAKDYARGDANIIAVMSKMPGMDKGRAAGALMSMQAEAVAYASQKGREGAGVTPEGIRTTLVNAAIVGGKMSRREAESFVDANKTAITRQAYHWVQDSGDTDAGIAMNRVSLAYGKDKGKVNIEEVEKNREGLTKKLNVVLEKSGLAGSEKGATDEEKRGIRALTREEDPVTRALAMIVGGQSGDAKLDMGTRQAIAKAVAPYAGTQRLERAKLISKTMTPGQRKRMGQKYGDKLRGEKGFTVEGLGEQVNNALNRDEGGPTGELGDLGSITELDAADDMRRRKGLDKQETGEGAGTGTAATTATTKALDAQSEMLDTMAKNMNKASEALLEAADKFTKSDLESKMLNYPDWVRGK